MPPGNGKWTGPLGCVAGTGLLALQVYAYLDVGLLSAWLIGGGIGLLIVGAASWFHYLDDKRSGAIRPPAVELPTADEFEKGFEEVEPGAVGTNQPRTETR